MKINQDEDSCTVESRKYRVIVKENDEGIIVDVYDRDDELVETETYWDDDVE